MGVSSRRKRPSSRRKRSVIGLLALAASAICLLPASQASAAEFNNACVNSLIPTQSSLIPVTMTANASPNPVEAGQPVTLSEIKQELAIPPAVFIAGYNAGVLTTGVNEIPTELLTRIIGTNTVEGEQLTNLVATEAETTITDPDGTPGTGDEEATPAAISVTYENQTWTAKEPGPISFREKTQEPLTNLEAGIQIESVVSGVIHVRFGCDPGTVEESAPPETIELEEGSPFASAEAIAPKPLYALNLTTTGSGSGSLQCDTGSGPEACASEYKEGTEVTVIANAGAGSEFVEFSGDCTGASCTLTMNEIHSVAAQFDVESVPLSVTEEGGGEGSVACEVNSSPASCNGSYVYGDTVNVVASPAAENNIDSLTGSGSAAGTCSVESGECEFELTEPSSVTVVFEPAGTKAAVEGNVYGEVPQTTSIESGCSTVYLGEFLPGVEADLEHAYENSCLVTLTSTGEETSLTAADLSGIDTGYLTQKPGHNYSLASPLLTGALELGEGGGTGPEGGALVSPVTLLTWTNPISKDLVGVGFKQLIGEHEPLHTGVYAKTITLTLEQTTP